MFLWTFYSKTPKKSTNLNKNQISTKIQQTAFNTDDNKKWFLSTKSENLKDHLTLEIQLCQLKNELHLKL